jgi:shikimate dehydrogenase
MGAVNTIVRRGDKYIGENTDGRGFVRGLSQVIDPAGKAIVIFGAGGAARAVSVELALAGASRIFVVNRGQEGGQQLVTLLLEKTPAAAELIPWKGTFSIPKNIDIVINATSIGLYPNVEETLDLDVASLLPHMVVADGIHNPPKTRLIRAAEGGAAVAWWMALRCL